jgi:hypothetical protein
MRVFFLARVRDEQKRRITGGARARLRRFRTWFSSFGEKSIALREGINCVDDVACVFRLMCHSQNRDGSGLGSKSQPLSTQPERRRRLPLFFRAIVLTIVVRVS